MALLDDLVPWWSLDEVSGSAIDAHGSNDLTDNATVGTGAGKVGNARNFVAANGEYLSIADNADLSGGDIDMTWSGWVNPESITGFHFIFAKGSGGTYEYGLYMSSDGKLHFEAASATDDSEVVANTFGALSVATWYFVVCQHDSVANEIRISVNDGTPDTAAHTTGTRDSTGDFNLGARGGASFFDGLLDEWGFWKRALTSGEITELYNAGAGMSYADLSGEEEPPVGAFNIFESPVIMGVV